MKILNKPKKLLTNQKKALNYIWDRDGTLGFLIKISSFALGVMYFLVGLSFIFVSTKLIILSLILFFLSFRKFKAYYLTRFFTRDDLMSGKEYLKWYDNEVKK